MNYSEQELIAAISSSDLRPTLFQPLPSDGALKTLQSLVRRCWLADPDLRPDMAEVVATLKTAMSQKTAQQAQQSIEPQKEGSASADGLGTTDEHNMRADEGGRTASTEDLAARRVGGASDHPISCPTCHSMELSTGGHEHCDESSGRSEQTDGNQEANSLSHVESSDPDQGSWVLPEILGSSPDGDTANQVVVSMGAFETVGARERMEDRHFVFTWAPGGTQPTVSASAYLSHEGLTQRVVARLLLAMTRRTYA